MSQPSMAAMSLTAWQVERLAGEIGRLLCGRWVQQVFQPTNSAIVLHLYGERARSRLVIDVHPGRLCVGLLAGAGPPNPLQPPPFCMLLRKHLEGTRLRAARAQEGDRVLYLAFGRPGDQAAPVVLVAELTGRSANLYLEVSGRLAGSLRPAPASRGLRPGEPYAPPPRLAGTPGVPDPGHQGRPGSEGPDGSADGGPVGGLLSAMGDRLTQRLAADQVEEERHILLKLVEGTAARLRRRLQHQMEDLREAEKAEEWRRKGELLLAYASQIPAGACKVLLPPAEHHLPEQPPLEIELMPDKSPVANAQAYFQRYRKARRAAEVQQANRLQTERTLFAIEQAAVFVREATRLDELAAVREEIQAVLTAARVDFPPAGLRALEKASAARASRRTASGRGAKGAPVERFVARYRSPDGLDILVGKSARGNDYLTTYLARPDELWLHARGVAGAHVVVRSGGQPVSERTLLQAAALAARLSAAGASGAPIDVDVTRRRDVRKPPGAPPGFVVYRNEKTLRVAPGRAPDRLELNAGSAESP